MNVEKCRHCIDDIVKSFHPRDQELFAGPLYLPSDFRDPLRQEFMKIVKGIPGSKEYYPTIVEFWVYSLFDFLESQMNDEKFEEQAITCLCEPVNGSVMNRQIHDCLSRLDTRYSFDFVLDGSELAIYRMFNCDKRLSYAIETTQTYYAFFYERATGTDVYRCSLSPSRTEA